MFGQFKDKRFLVSGLKEGCNGVLGIERSSGRRGPGRRALTPTVKGQRSLRSPRAASC